MPSGAELDCHCGLLGGIGHTGTVGSATDCVPGPGRAGRVGVGLGGVGRTQMEQEFSECSLNIIIGMDNFHTDS